MKKRKVATISNSQLFQVEKPRFNAYQCGSGSHGDTKYNRTKAKRSARKEIAMY